MSTARACKIISLERSGYYYVSKREDQEVEEKLRWYAEHYPTRGCPFYTKRIRKEGYAWNKKRVRRVYNKLGMNKRKRKWKRRIPNPNKEVLLQPLASNLCWSADFMQDRLENGVKMRVLNIIDDYNREALACKVSSSFPSEHVVEQFEQLIEWHGKSLTIRTDNGTEFMAEAFQKFCNRHQIKHLRIQKGKPMQNGYCERFNRTLREDVLNAYLFETKNQMQELINHWMEDYNQNHPHSSLGDMSPREFKQRLIA